MSEIIEEKLRQATNKTETVGTVSEFNITVKECKKDCNIDGEDRKITSAMIYGKLVVDVNGESIDHSLSALDLSKHTKSGDEKAQFKGIMTALGYTYAYDEAKGRVVYTKGSDVDVLIPKINSTITFKYLDGTENKTTIKGDGRGTRVVVKGRLGQNESLNKDQSDLVFYPTTYVGSISKSSVPDTDKAEFVCEGYIKQIVSEYNQSGATTGRLLVDLDVPNFFGDIDVFSFKIPKSWEVDDEDEPSGKRTLTSNDFAEFFKKGMSVAFYGSNVMQSFGNATKVTSTKSFGAKSNVTSGFKNLEWQVFGGDILSEKDSFKDELIKQAEQRYETTLDEKYNTRLEDYRKSQTNKSNATSTSPKGLGTKPTIVDDDDDNPFK